MRLHSPESIENGVKSSFQRNAITTTTIWLRGKCVSAPNVWSSFNTICLDTHICIRIREIQGGCDEVFLTDSLDSKSTEDDSSNHDDGADNVATNENDKIYDDESDSNNLFLGEGGWIHDEEENEIIGNCYPIISELNALQGNDGGNGDASPKSLKTVETVASQTPNMGSPNLENCNVLSPEEVVPDTQFKEKSHHSQNVSASRGRARIFS
ncbi:hypothetical protein Tco_0705919 [Tanacetum coccineum]|uniref:Uncharacterized protein n=1 Tax=Tanacetum coccineum TaxID=301880 RepID=A0ABQ4Y5X5_9ASTR